MSSSLLVTWELMRIVLPDSYHAGRVARTGLQLIRREVRGLELQRMSPDSSRRSDEDYGRSNPRQQCGDLNVVELVCRRIGQQSGFNPLINGIDQPIQIAGRRERLPQDRLGEGAQK